MHELLVNLRFLQDKLRNFAVLLTDAATDIEELIISQSETPQIGFKDTIETLANIMNLNTDKDLISLKEPLNQLIDIFQNSLFQTENAERQIEAILEAAKVEFKDNVRAEFNISAISEYGHQISESTSIVLSRITAKYKADLEKIDAVDKTLAYENPDRMASVNVYRARLTLLSTFKALIQKNNLEIERTQAELDDYVQMMRSYMRKSGEIMIVHRLDAIIKRLTQFPKIDDEAFQKLMRNVSASLKQLSTKHKPEGKLGQINFASIENLLAAYKQLVSFICKLSYSFVEKSVFNISLNDSLEEHFAKTLQQFPSYKAIKTETEEFFTRHKRIYNQAYDNTHYAIKHFGDLDQLKTKNLVLIDQEIPKLEARIVERIKIKNREDEYLQELAFFDAGIYLQVMGEGFEKIKEQLFFTDKSRKIISNLKKHAEGHPRKSELIKLFIANLENTKCLADLFTVISQATLSDELMQCRTIFGRKFGIQSTTRMLIRQLDVELKKIVDIEKIKHPAFNSVKSAIDAEKDILFAEELKYNFSEIYKDFIRKIDVNHGRDEIVLLLKEELIHIGLSNLDNAGKVCRMAIAIHHTKQDLTEKMRVTGDLNNPLYISLNRFVAAHVDALKTVHIHQGESPFSYRYQELRKHMGKVTTFRTLTLEEFWDSIERVAGNPDSEVRKLESMRRVMYQYYCGIRESYRGSPGLFFSKGSRLATALGEFLIAREGFYMKEEDVPRRIGFRLF